MLQFVVPHNLNLDAGVFTNFFDDNRQVKYSPDPLRILDTHEFERSYNDEQSNTFVIGGARVFDGRGKVGV